MVIEKTENELTFKQTQLVNGDWIAIVVDDELTKNEAILLEQVGINMRLKNLLNSDSTADSTIFDNLSDEEEFILSVYIVMMLIEKFENKNYRKIDINKLDRKANVLLENKLKNHWKTRDEVSNQKHFKQIIKSHCLISSIQLLDEMSAPTIRTLNYDTSDDDTISDLKAKLESLQVNDAKLDKQ